jgi:predicted metalloprotease with PDZ domain
MDRLAVVALVLLLDACAHQARPTLFRSWGEQLRDAPARSWKKESVSLLLGDAPRRCEPIGESKPRIGMQFEPSAMTAEPAVVRRVAADGPASKAGISTGDVITSVAGKPVTTPQQVFDAIGAIAKVGEPMELETSRGRVSVVPMPSETQQCYWEIDSGAIARSSHGSYVNRWAGSSAGGSAAYERFFRAACQIRDGLVTICQSNWQE